MKSSIQLITSCLFALGITLITFSSLHAQTFIIGDSTGVNASNAYPTPYGDRFEAMRAQYLYLASDLLAAGVPAGNITSIGFFVVDVNGAGIHDNYTIKLGLTNQATIGGWITGNTTVYSATVYEPYLGLNTHTLNTPLFWNGTSNLVVEICHGPDNAENAVFQSQSAIVQLTTGLGYDVSYTYRANNSGANNVCIYNGVASTNNVDPQARPRLWLTSCTAPIQPILDAKTSNSAQISWQTPAGGTPQEYEWAYGSPNFIPGSAGIQYGTGTTLDTTVTLTNLNGNTAYNFYVRSTCDIGYSTWAGPVPFLTEASCNDEFTDTNAGLLDNYDTSENYVRVFCPDLNGNALRVGFTLFYTGIGDTLRIYNGNSTSAPLFGAFSGIYPPLSGPGPFTATTSTGCITVQFKSDTVASPLDVGWLGSLTCAPLPADSCYKVLKLKTNVVNFDFAQVSWIKMFGAPGYTYQLVELPSTPVAAGTTMNNVLDFNNLTSGTHYRFVVRGNCDNGANSVWDTLYFDTPVRCNALPNGASNAIMCGLPVQVSATGSGLWDVTGCGNNNHTPGKEYIYRFTAPQTREYGLKILLTANANAVKYLYKPVSAGCGTNGWSCLGIFNNSNDSTSFGPLVAGQEYYILVDPMTTAPVTQRFRILGCTPLNDLPQNAIHLDLNAPCTDNVYSNQDANFEVHEPNPDTVAADGYKGRWTEPAENTVWFSFEAPASGTVTISTNKSIINPNGDTQIALYSVGDPADYASFVLLESDEDNGSGFNSNFTYTGLEEGASYYLQVDSWDINAEGPFCIAVDDDAVRQSNDACSQYVALDVAGFDWVNIYTSPEISDIGKLVLAINPQGQDLDTVFARIQTFPTIPRAGNQVPYMPAYFRLRSSNPPTGPVAIRLFFTNSELQALVDTAGLPANDASDLVVSQYNGANTDCNQLNNTGPSNLITAIDPVLMTNSFYLEFNTAVFGEFGVHFGSVALPLELLSFTGKIAERSNLLAWTTKTEKNIQWHIVERSADAVNWSELGRVAGAADSKTGKTYGLSDDQPLASAYYRLRSVDADGTATVSSAIRLVRPDRQFVITEVLPNPVSDRLTVRFHTAEEGQALLRVVDVAGRLILERTTETQTGMNEIALPFAGLPAGIYQVLLTAGAERATPVRVVKQ